jgi:membrane protein YqaA with SNARE-associated domain
LDLLLLFFSSLIAATIFPLQSEAVLAGLHLQGKYSVVLLVTIATFGNVFGACINWILGRYIERCKKSRWFPFKEKTLENAARIYQRYGIFTLLFSWVPIIGDPLTLIAGILRANFFWFLLLVTAGKLLRYLAVVALIS